VQAEILTFVTNILGAYIAVAAITGAATTADSGGTELIYGTKRTILASLPVDHLPILTTVTLFVTGINAALLAIGAIARQATTASSTGADLSNRAKSAVVATRPIQGTVVVLASGSGLVAGVQRTIVGIATEVETAATSPGATHIAHSAKKPIITGGAVSRVVVATSTGHLITGINGTRIAIIAIAGRAIAAGTV